MSETTGFQQKQFELRVLMEELQNYGDTEQKVFTDDKKLLNRYFNCLGTYKGYSNALLSRLKGLKQKASGLIAYFKVKYHFE